jgi:hypothetical protein
LFLPGRWPRTEDTNRLRSLGEEDEEKLALSGMADDDLPLLTRRMLLVVEDSS